MRFKEFSTKRNKPKVYQAAAAEPELHVKNSEESDADSDADADADDLETTLIRIYEKNNFD